jgi:hypothetical protein
LIIKDKIVHKKVPQLSILSFGTAIFDLAEDRGGLSAGISCRWTCGAAPGMTPIISMRVLASGVRDGFGLEESCGYSGSGERRKRRHVL